MDGQREERAEYSTTGALSQLSPHPYLHTFPHPQPTSISPHPSPLTPYFFSHHPLIDRSPLTSLSSPTHHITPHSLSSPTHHLTPHFLFPLSSPFTPHFLFPLPPCYHTSPLPLHPSPPPSSLPTPPTFRLFGCSLSSSTCFFLSSLSTFLL